MSTIQYLAYGSNLLPARLAARLGDLDIIGTVALPGWSLRFHKRGADGSGKCDLVKETNALAHGALYALSIDSIETLDKIEGVGHGYDGRQITLADGSDAYVYLARPSHIDENLRPFDWYHAFVRQGAAHHQFPTAYLEAIDAVTAIQDNDASRRQQNYAVLNTEA